MSYHFYLLPQIFLRPIEKFALYSCSKVFFEKFVQEKMPSRFSWAKVSDNQSLPLIQGTSNLIALVFSLVASINVSLKQQWTLSCLELNHSVRFDKFVEKWTFVHSNLPTKFNLMTVNFPFPMRGCCCSSWLLIGGVLNL